MDGEDEMVRIPVDVHDTRLEALMEFEAVGESDARLEDDDVDDAVGERDAREERVELMLARADCEMRMPSGRMRDLGRPTPGGEGTAGKCAPSSAQGLPR